MSRPGSPAHGGGDGLEAALAAARRRVTGIPALGAAVVDAEGVRAAVVGTVARDSAEPVLLSDAWHIGSCTKSLTAALYARLVEQGRARWDASVAELVPDLTVHPGWAERSVTELAWCRAGVAADLPLRDLTVWAADRRPLVDQRTAAARLALAPAPVRPGRFVYSNLSYLVLGAAIDRIAASWEDALRTELLDPAGVTGAGFGPPPRIWGHRPRGRIGPVLVGRGPALDPADPGADNPPVLSSAGTLHLPLEDWARLQRMFQADAPGPLSAASVARLQAMPERGGMAMGWGADREGRPGMQGSNTAWSATALQSRDRTRTALVVANDGRSRVLAETAAVAAELLAD